MKKLHDEFLDFLNSFIKEHSKYPVNELLIEQLKPVRLEVFEHMKALKPITDNPKIFVDVLILMDCIQSNSLGAK